MAGSLSFLFYPACFGIAAPCDFQLLDCAADVSYHLGLFFFFIDTTSVSMTSESVKKLLFHMRKCLKEFSGGY